MMVHKVLLLDSDVLITAKNKYYSFDICPGYWSSLIHYHEEGRVYSIDRVKREILKFQKEDKLASWVKQALPRAFFLASNTDVTKAYGEIIQWANQHPQYYDQAKNEFAQSADGWLVAHAVTRGATVVTNEVSAPESERDIKLPDVCRQFDVLCVDTFSMLRGLKIRFSWAEGNIDASDSAESE